MNDIERHVTIMNLRPKWSASIESKMRPMTRPTNSAESMEFLVNFSSQ